MKTFPSTGMELKRAPAVGEAGGPRRQSVSWGGCAALGVGGGACQHHLAPEPEELLPGILMGRAWGEAGKMDTGQRVGPTEAGTCLVCNREAGRGGLGATGGAMLVGPAPSFHRPSRGWGLGAGGWGVRTQALGIGWGRGTSGSGAHSGAGASGHREATMRQ